MWAQPVIPLQGDDSPSLTLIRENELARLQDALARVRAITLVGPAGVGKSWLAARVASRLGASSERTTLVLDFATCSSRAASRLLKDLESRGSEHAVVVLDNCDHVLGACARFVEAYLLDSPKLIITAREPLGANDELVWRVDPLPIHDEAVALFLQLARRKDPELTLSSSSIADIQRICELVDGIPLGIELAAGRAGAMRLRSIADRLDAAIRLCPTERSSPTPPQGFGRSIERTLVRLSARERDLLWRLSVFEGSWDATSLQAVCYDPESRADLLPLLARLVTCNFVVRIADETGASVRYRLLSVIRRYAADRLARIGIAEELRARHATWYSRMVASLTFREMDTRTLENLRLDQPNLVAALQWAVDASLGDHALILGNTLHWLWHWNGQFTTSRHWFERILELPNGAPRDRAMLMNWASTHAMAQGDLAAAIEWSERAQAAAAGLSDAMISSRVMYGLATVLLDQGQLQRADEILCQQLETCTRPSTRGLRARVLLRLARLHLELGDVTRAYAFADESSRILEELGNGWLQGRLLDVFGAIALERGDLEAAEDYLIKDLDLAQSLGGIRALVDALMGLTQLELSRGNGKAARAWIARAFNAVEPTEDALALIRVLEAVVALRAASRPEAALHLAGWIAVARQRQQSVRLPREQVRYTAALRVALHQLRPKSAETALAAGHRLSRQATLALAGELLEAPETFVTAPPVPGADLLTPRESTIAGLLVRGLTNRAIGAELYISEGTVRAHVEHILGKLQVRSRVEVAAQSSDYGLLSPDDLAR